MVDNKGQPDGQVEAIVSAAPEPKSFWQVGSSYFGNDDKVEGFSHTESEDEQEDECREDIQDELGLDCESSNSREVLGASISNSFDSIVNAPSEEIYLNDDTPSEHEGPSDDTANDHEGPSSLPEEMYLNDDTPNDRQGPSSLSLSVSVSSAENHQEAKVPHGANETTVQTVLTEESVKRAATEETNESDSNRSRESARSASILDDESIDDEDDGDDATDATELSEKTDDEPVVVVRRKSRIEELKEQLGLLERQISASSSEGSDATDSISTANDSVDIMSPAPTVDSAYDGETEIEHSASEDSITKPQGASSAGIHSILVKTSSDEKKKKNSEKRVQFDLASVQSSPQQVQEPKSFWDVLDNMLVNTDLGILDRSCKEDSSDARGKQKSLMDDMAKEIKFKNLDLSSGGSENSNSPDNHFPVVDFKAIDKLIAANHRHPNRLPSIPECTERSFDVSSCDDQSLTEEQKRMGLTSLADMSVASNMSESIAETKVTADESEMGRDATEATEENKSFFSGWNCGNLKCVNPDTKDMCGPTMQLPGMMALHAMNNIPMNENLIHWTDSEQQNESISRSIQMANEHVNGAKAYLSMIDGVDSDEDEDSTVVSEGTARASNVMADENSSVASCQSGHSTEDTDPNREREEPPGWQKPPSPKPEDPADPASIFQDAPSSPKEAPIARKEERGADPAPSFRDAPSSPRDVPIVQHEDERSYPSSSTVRKPMDPPTSPQPTQQATAIMEISEARKSRKQAEQQTRTRKPDPESFEASKKPETKPKKAGPKPEKAKKTVAKSKKMDPTESKPKTSKSSPAKKTEKKLIIDLTTETTPATTPKATTPKSETKKKKTHRRRPTPEMVMLTTEISTVEPTLGSNQDYPIVLMEEIVEEMSDETPEKKNASSSSSSSSTTVKTASVAPTPEHDGMASTTTTATTTTSALSKRLTSRLQKKQAERQHLKEKLLSQMPPLYALKPDEIALILEVGTREYLSDRKSYNLAYEQARWCVLAAQSNMDQSLTMDMIQQIIREECQRFRE